MDTINLLAIADESDIGDFGVEALLEDFLQTLNQLAIGIEVDLTPNHAHIFRGILIGILGDIPAVNYLIGMKEGVGPALRICRHCFGFGAQIQQNFTEFEFQLRNLEVHQAIVQVLEHLEGPAREALSTFLGVNSSSVLDPAPFFDLIAMSPQDLMHTVLEGGLSHEMKLLLRHFVANYLDIDVLNQRIKEFDLGYQEVSNRPSPITQEHLNVQGPGLPGQKASQLWLLARMLHFLVHDFVPAEDPHRQCWELHLRILFAAAAPEIHPETPQRLADAIEEHHQAFRLCYPHENITPKLHYYVHLPSIQLRFEEKERKRKKKSRKEKTKERKKEKKKNSTIE